MSPPYIQSTNFSLLPLVSFPVRLGSRLWENLTAVKVLGSVAFFGLLYFVWQVYRSRTNRPNRISSLPPFTVEIPQPQTPSLPDGIEKAQVDEIIKIFAGHFKCFQKPENVKTYGKDPLKPIIWLGELEKTCKGKEPEQAEVRTTFKYLCAYLQEQKIIESHMDMRTSHYQFILHEEFIQKL